MLQRVPIPKLSDLVRGYHEVTHIPNYRNILYHSLKHISEKSYEFQAGLPHDLEKVEIPIRFRENITLRLLQEVPCLINALEEFADALDPDERHNAPEDLDLFFQALRVKTLQIDKFLTIIYSSVTSFWDLIEHKYCSRVHPNIAIGNKMDQKFGRTRNFVPTEPLDSFRWRKLVYELKVMAIEIEDGFHSVARSIETMVTTADLDVAVESEREGEEPITLVDLIGGLCDEIMPMIERLAQPDFLPCQIRWGHIVGDLRKMINHIYQLIISEITAINRDELFGVCLLTKSRFHTFIPILKLARIFVNKIVKTRCSELLVVSKMSMKHMSAMYYSIEVLKETFRSFVECEVWLQPAEKPIWIRTFLSQVIHAFKIPLEVIKEHCTTPHNTCASIPCASVDFGTPVELKTAKEWSIMWAGQFDLAMESFVIAFKEKL